MIFTWCIYEMITHCHFVWFLANVRNAHYVSGNKAKMDNKENLYILQAAKTINKACSRFAKIELSAKKWYWKPKLLIFLPQFRFRFSFANFFHYVWLTLFLFHFSNGFLFYKNKVECIMCIHYEFWLLYVSANKRKFKKYDRGCQPNFQNVMKTEILKIAIAITTANSNKAPYTSFIFTKKKKKKNTKQRRIHVIRL